VYLSKSEVFIDSIASEHRFAQLYKTGVIMNLVNPKVLIFFLAFFPSFLWDAEGNVVLQFYVLGFLFMGVALTVFSIMAFLAGRISQFLKEHPNTGPFLKWLQIFVFIGIALYILLG